MAHEQTPWRKPSIIPKGFDWPALDSRDGDDLETHYRHTLETLGKKGGMLGRGERVFFDRKVGIALHIRIE